MLSSSIEQESNLSSFQLNGAQLNGARAIKTIKSIIPNMSVEQKCASEQIITEFITGNRHIILLAQPQSGKTDTYLFVGFHMLFNGYVDDVVCIGGFDDKELVSQLKNYDKQLSRFKRDLLMYNVTSRDIVEFDEKIKNGFKVLSGSDLKKNKFHEQCKNTLFIWEESHFAQDKTNRPYTFLKSCGISANGDDVNVEYRNNYFLSVSATPFSEVSDCIHENQNKKIVIMKPGVGYIGLQKMFESKRIVGFDNWKEGLKQILEKQNALKKSSYSIVRVFGDKMDEAIAIAKKCNIKYEVFDAIERDKNKNNKMSSFNDLEKEPSSPTVIFIRGMLRMGKVVPKTHLSFVMETSKNINTDCLLQGLLGRTFGYHTNQDIIAYISNTVVKGTEIEEYLSMMSGNTGHEFPICDMPKKGKNLKRKKSSCSNSEWFDSIPIILNANDDNEENKNDQEHDLSIKHNVLRQFQNSIKNASCINCNGQKQTDEISNQIQFILSNKLDNCDIKHIENHNGSVNETYKDMPLLFQKSINENKPIENTPAGCGYKRNDEAIINVWMISTNKYQNLGFPKGSMILQARTKTDNCDNAFERLKRNIPITTKLEAFTRKEEDGGIVIGNGSYNINAPIETSQNKTTMKEYISNIIMLYRSEIVNGMSLPNYISSNQDENGNYKGILVSQQVLVALEKYGSIYNHIHSTFGMTLKIKRVAGRIPEELRQTGLTRLSKIEWQ